MLNYETFKNVVTENFKEYLPVEFHNYELKMQVVTKINMEKDGISLFPLFPNTKTTGQFISPTIYINDMYEEYKRMGSVDSVLRKEADKMVSSIKKTQICSFDISAAKKNIVFQLVNTEQNRKMLAIVPHRQFLDLSIVYRCIVDINSDGIASSLVNNSLAKSFNMDEEALFKVAFKNTKRLLPPSIRSIKDALNDTGEYDIPDIPDEYMMWVISNERSINGATSILYEEVLHRLAEQLGTDFYICPSSIHESIAISADTSSPEQLAEIVREVNMDQVELEERLSNQVYYYNNSSRKLFLATDTPNKTLI